MIELRNRSYGEYNERFGSKEIEFDIYKDGVETAWIVVFDSGEELHIQDLFPTGNELDDRDSDDNIIGVVGVRQLFRLLKEEFPNATRLTGTRYGGAQHIDEDSDIESHEVSYRI